MKWAWRNVDAGGRQAGRKLIALLNENESGSESESERGIREMYRSIIKKIRYVILPLRLNKDR